MIKAIIFDLDDTLYPEHHYTGSGFRAVALYVADRCGVSAHWVEQMLWLEHHRNPKGVFDRFLDSLECRNLSTQDLVECYRNHLPDIVLDNEVRVLLLELRSRYRLGVVSDGWLTVQQNKVRSLGLETLMDCVCFTDQWGREFWKPHQRGFRHVLETLGVLATEACYVADNPLKDFIAPNQLGMYSVLVLRPGSVYFGSSAAEGGEPQATIRSLADLRRLLETWS